MDLRAYLWVNRLQRRTGWAHGFLTAYAKDGIVLFAVLLVAGWWIARRRGTDAVAGVVSAGVAALIGLAANQLIGHLVDRARPFTAHPSASLLVSRTKDFSFPSDHSVVAAAVAVGLVLVAPRLGVVGIVLAVLMAFARVYVGTHYPGDVLGGLAIGAAVALISGTLVVRVLRPLLERLRTSPLRALVTA